MGWLSVLPQCDAPFCSRPCCSEPGPSATDLTAERASWGGLAGSGEIAPVDPPDYSYPEERDEVRLCPLCGSVTGTRSSYRPCACWRAAVTCASCDGVAGEHTDDCEVAR